MSAGDSLSTSALVLVTLNADPDRTSRASLLHAARKVHNLEQDVAEKIARVRADMLVLRRSAFKVPDLH